MQQKRLPHGMTEAARIWHKAHRMPVHPTVEQRIAWHREHQKHCACRPIPKSLEELIS